MITPDEIARLREMEKKAMPKPCTGDKETPYNIRSGMNVIARFNTVFDFDYFVAAVNALPNLLDEIERLQAQLRAATLVVGNDPDTFDWNALSKIEEQEREIERLRDELKETGTTLAISRKGVSDLSDDLATAIARAEAAEAERDATKAILSDPEAVHTNIMLGRIALPDYYVRTTDTNGPFALLTADLAAALKRAEAAERELYVLRVSNKHAVEIWRKRLKAKTK